MAVASASLFKPRKTPLYELHKEHAGSFAPWQGCVLATHFRSILDEHQVANDDLGLFDLGYRGFINLEGPGALLLLNRLATCDVSAISVGSFLQVPFVYPDGTLVDLVRLTRVESEVWTLIFTNPAPQKAIEWISREAEGSECWMDDLSNQYAWVCLSGARAQEYLSASNPSLRKLLIGNFSEALTAGVACLVWRSQETAFEIACQPELLSKIIRLWWAEKSRPMLCGWASYENWRLENGLLRYGYEIKEGITPFDLGLDARIDLDRESFTGRSALIRQQDEGLKHILVYFYLESMRLPRPQAPVYCGDKAVGLVCAGGFSPRVKRPIGAAWVRTAEVDFDQLQVELRRQRYPLVIKKPPFF